tara:strand:- start:217 stop:510 length:294 start_codon:yes stop_codon:yes gene_type:complete
MTDTWIVIAGLALGTFGIRFAGVLLGHSLPAHGGWARALRALPGCLIVSLVAVLLLGGGPFEWLAGLAAATVALLTRSLPLTMLVGVGCVAALRFFL